MKALFIWLLTIALVSGMETVAWRVPVDRVVEGGLGHPKVTKLEKAPGESVFFEEGDELWDLTDVFEIERWVPDDPSKTGKIDPEKRVLGRFAGDWLIWNARTKKVVGRGSWDDLDEVESKIVYPQVRSTLMLEKNGRVEGSVVTVCGSGERTEASEGKLWVKVSPNLGRGRRPLDLNYEAKFEMGEGRSTEVTSALSINLEEKVTLAEWHEDGDRFKLSGTFVTVSEDGVLMKSVRLREVKGRALRLETLGINYAVYDGMKLKNGLKVGVYWVPPDLSRRVEKPRPQSEIRLPSELEGLSGGLYEDVSKLIDTNVLKSEVNGALALMDHSTSTLIAVNDRVNLERIGSLVEASAGHTPVNVMCHVEWEERTGMLLMRSGDMGSIRQVRDGAQELELKVAPDVTVDDRGVELWFSMEMPSRGISLNSSAAMVDGVPLLVGEMGKIGTSIKCVVVSDER